MSNKARRMLVLLLIILKEVGPTAACSSSCSSHCRCSNMGLTSVPQYLPTDITWLSLDNNAITTLNQSDFSRYRSLTTLDLSYNQISMIHDKTFHILTGLNHLDLDNNHLTNLTAGIFAGLGNLQVLHLYDNQLTSLPAGIFVGLGNLEELYLESNNIHSIEAGTFSDTTQLHYLYLEHNSISTITAGTFRNLLQLDTLTLSDNNINTFPVDLEALSNLNISVLSYLELNRNQLQTLPPMAYDILANIYDVNINNNPWQCDCRMVPFKQRMNGSYPFEDQIRCAGPANLKLQYLRDVNPEDLICEETTPVYSTSSTEHIQFVDSTDPPLVSTVTVTKTNFTGPAEGGIVLSVPLLATLCIFLGLFIICAIAFAVWCMYKRRQRDPTPQQGFSNTNPTGTSSGHDQIGLQAVATNDINSQSETPHLGRHDSLHIYSVPKDDSPDLSEYASISENTQSESPNQGNRQSLDSFGYLNLTNSLPPENQPGSGQIQQHGSFNDDYEVPSPSLYPGEGPQSYKYVNSQVAAAAKDAATGPQDVVYENGDETAAGPQIDEELVDNQSQTAAAPGADSPHHYEPLRNPSSQQQHTYTSLMPHGLQCQ